MPQLLAGFPAPFNAFSTLDTHGTYIGTKFQWAVQQTE